MLRMRFLQLYLPVRKTADPDSSDDEGTDFIWGKCLGGVYGTEYLRNKRPPYQGTDDNR